MDTEPTRDQENEMNRESGEKTTQSTGTNADLGMISKGSSGTPKADPAKEKSGGTSASGPEIEQDLQAKQ